MEQTFLIWGLKVMWPVAEKHIINFFGLENKLCCLLQPMHDIRDFTVTTLS